MLQTCFHCDLPIPNNLHLNLEVLGVNRKFCCHGCLAVAATIVENNLENYYTYRTTSSSNQSEKTQINLEELELFDKTEPKQIDENSQEINLFINNISCAACSWLITKSLLQNKNILNATLNLATYRLNLVFNKDIKLSQIIKQIDDLGYQASIYTTDEASLKQEQNNKILLKKIGVAGFLWMQIMMATMATWSEFNIDLSQGMHKFLAIASLALTTPIVLYSCKDFYYGAYRSLKNKMLNMDVSISLAVLLSFTAGIYSTITGKGDLYFDAIGMFALLLLIGRYLEGKAYSLINNKNTILPKTCIKIENNQQRRVFTKDVKNDDLVLLQAHEVIAFDGRTQTITEVDEAILTGESLPTIKNINDELFAGSINLKNDVLMQVKEIKNTKINHILDLTAKAQSYKPKIAQLADVFSHYFLIIIILLTLLTFVFWLNVDKSQAFWVALSLLIATCPCAMALATPIAITIAANKMQENGLVLFKATSILSLRKINAILLDKTGTLTNGKLSIKNIKVINNDYSQEQILEIASILESSSNHPIAKAFHKTNKQAENLQDILGFGLIGEINNKTYKIGSLSFIDKNLSNVENEKFICLGNENGLIAYIYLEDNLREDSFSFIRKLKEKKIYAKIISGDEEKWTAKLANSLQIDFAANLSPGDKFQILQDLQKNNKVLMLGDGINDIPAFAASDISIAMQNSPELAKTKADAILLSNNLNNILDAIALSQKTYNIIIENFLWATFYNLIIIPFAICGKISPFYAALGMSLSSLIVVLNAMRIKNF